MGPNDRLQQRFQRFHAVCGVDLNLTNHIKHRFRRRCWKIVLDASDVVFARFDHVCQRGRPFQFPGPCLLLLVCHDLNAIYLKQRVVTDLINTENK